MKKIYGVIYLIQCLITNKIYIGKTTKEVEIRWKQHSIDALKNKSTLHFHKAIRKYGIKCFIYQIIDTAKNKDQLNKKEKYWIKKYDSSNSEYGYNMTFGGDGFNGTDEVKKKISVSLIGKKQSAETIQKRIESRKGYVCSNESRMKMSISAIGNKNGLGKRMSEEHKEKLRMINKGKIMSKEQKNKISITKKGIPWTQARWEAQKLSKRRNLYVA